MATTKKVARKKVTRKKTVKNVTVPLKSAKKVTKKTVKKTVKKATKKATSKKGIITDRTRQQRTSFAKKLATVEALHRKEKTVTSENTALPSKIRLLKPVLRDRLGLSVLSPARFPMTIDALAIQTARLGGVAFVILGGLFALNFAQYVLGDNPILSQHARSMTAQLCDATVMNTLEYNACLSQQTLAQNAATASESLETSSSGASGSLAGSATAAAAAIDPSILSIDNTQPTVTFTFNQSPPLSDTVTIDINVDGADSVDVLLYKDSWNGFEDKFTATQVGAGKWRFNWDTTKHSDANYLVKAEVYNAYETNGYIQNHSSYLEVDNSTTAASGGAAVDTEPAATVRVVTGQPVDALARIRVDVPDAKDVRFSATDSAGSASYLSSSARETTSGSNVWMYDWDTRGYSNGDYVVNVHVENENSGKKYNAGTVPVKIKHADPGTGPVDTTVDATVDATVAVADDGQEVKDLPEVELIFTYGKKLSGFTELRVDTLGAQAVKLYAIPEGSTVQKYIGNATKVSPKVWILRYHTKSLPNGKYDFYAEVTNTFGTYSGDKTTVEVNNPLSFNVDTQEQESIREAVDKIAIIQKEVTGDVVKAAPADTSVELTEEQQDHKQADELIAKFNERIDQELGRLASAYRSKDTERIEIVRVRISQLKQEIAIQAATLDNKDVLIARINTRIDEIVTRYTESIDEVDTLIAERIQRDIFKDSDKDGISDYDEVRIYKTNPLIADTDGDGFIDGAEVESGYDPTDATREVAIAYESPKEQGVMRADVLRVDSVEAHVLATEEVTIEQPAAGAVITGVALPNSYATIYIFSTPVVVTVKTDEDGAWRYRYDKELEDGEHNVYVGVTDNAGKIVAKSEPFTFVKQAQAFTPVDAAVTGSAQIVETGSEDSLMTQYMVYLIVSISVVSIGLVLILLGLHLDTRGRRYPEVVNPQE